MAEAASMEEEGDTGNTQRAGPRLSEPTVGPGYTRGTWNASNREERRSQIFLEREKASSDSGRRKSTAKVVHSIRTTPVTKSGWL